KLHIADGRQFLLNTADRYDVAIIDSTHPKAVDSWILYTLEFNNLVRERLDVGGIAVQWLPLHGLSEQEFKIIVRSFLTAFPKMTLWANVGFETYGQVGYAKLVGTKEGPLTVNPQQLAKRLRDTDPGKDLAPWGIRTAEELLDLFVAGPESVSAWTEGLPIQTDDHPIIPYTTRYTKGRRMVPALLLGVREPITPWLDGNVSTEHTTAIALAAEAQGFVIAGNLATARELLVTSPKIGLFEHQTTTTEPYYTALSELYPDNHGKQFEAASQLAALGHEHAARTAYQRSLKLRPKDLRTRLDFAHFLLGSGATKESIELLTTLRDEYPHAAIVHFNLGAAVFATGDAEAAARHLKRALSYDDELYGARIELARTLIASNQLDAAERELNRAKADNPHDADVYHLTAKLRAIQGKLPDAREHMNRARRLDPYRSAYIMDDAWLCQRERDLDCARQAYRTLVRYYPHARDLPALRALAEDLQSDPDVPKTDDAD
ncbi:MAG: tetratricopeptide repeat protein, partial [Polyangiaceae bacterium]|nr:tetratricopeptide repeat protein [Polyangiaceae bacterium]